MQAGRLFGLPYKRGIKMFEIKENELIEKMKCRYEDENGNIATLFRQPERNIIRLVFKSPKNVTFDKLEINVSEPGGGCNFNYSYDGEDESITKEYLDSSINNISMFVNYVVGLDNAIRLLGTAPEIMAAYLGFESESKEERQEAVSRAKYGLITQYPELKQLFDNV